ncbi:MAG: ABC transporter ATP-binding protein [Phycisphaerales bacterium]
MSTTIAISNLSKHYKAFLGGGGRNAVTKAVDDISLTIPAGHLFFLLGPSGCGKTTLLRMIAGFIDPTAGSIRFNGSDVTHTPPAKRNCGMVFQSYALWPHMTVLQNVEFGLKVRKVPKDERRARGMEALESVRMDPYAERKPNQLSGGQQQRVALARALVVRPSVLLLDEPLSNLDAKLRLEMRHEIRRICKETGITTVYVTHDQKEALSMADGMAVLDMGVIAQVGTPRALYDRPGSKFVADFLGETNFIEGVLERIEGGTAHVKTAAGTLAAAADSVTRKLNPGRNVVCSIRPEAITLGTAAGTAESTTSLTGRVVESVYLGEMSQHHVELPGGTRIKVFELHPAGAERGPDADAHKPGGLALLRIDAKDIVVLPG